MHGDSSVRSYAEAARTASSKDLGHYDLFLCQTLIPFSPEGYHLPSEPLGLGQLLPFHPLLSRLPNLKSALQPSPFLVFLPHTQQLLTWWSFMCGCYLVLPECELCKSKHFVSCLQLASGVWSGVQYTAVKAGRNRWCSHCTCAAFQVLPLLPISPFLFRL